jgi:hypothetical protein
VATVLPSGEKATARNVTVMRNPFYVLDLQPYALPC